MFLNYCYLPTTNLPLTLLTNQHKVTAYAHGDMGYDQATGMMRETIRDMGQAAAQGLGSGQAAAQGLGSGQAAGPGLGSGLAAGSGLGSGQVQGPGLGSGQASGPGLGHVDVQARARLLPVKRHTVVAVPAFNPDDTNSALLTYIQVNYPFCCKLIMLCSLTT